MRDNYDRDKECLFYHVPSAQLGAERVYTIQPIASCCFALFCTIPRIVSHNQKRFTFDRCQLLPTVPHGFPWLCIEKVTFLFCLEVFLFVCAIFRQHCIFSNGCLRDRGEGGGHFHQDFLHGRQVYILTVCC